jgi:hypothetical protein
MLASIDAVCFARMIGVVVEPRVIDAGKMEGFTRPDTVAGAGIESAVMDDDLFHDGLLVLTG